MADTLDIVNESNDLEFELDNLIISGTIDLEDYYTKEQTDSLLQENYYNKQEVDDKLSDISSGESYTQGSGINISEDNVISIDNTVALKTDLNDYQEKFDYIRFSRTSSPVPTISSNGINYQNGTTINSNYLQNSQFFLPLIPSDNITFSQDTENAAIKIDIANTVALKTDIPNTDSFVTESDLSGRVIPSGSSTNFNQSGQLEISSGSQNILCTNTNILWRNNNITYGAIYNISSNELAYGNSKTGTDRVEYKFNDIQTQIDGNTLESNLTNGHLNIGKAYLCNETSTSGTYVQGHVYKIGGASGAFTTTDITATSSVDLSNYPTNEDLEGRVSPNTTKVNFNENGSVRFYGSSTSRYTDISGDTIELRTSNNTGEYVKIMSSGIYFPRTNNKFGQHNNDPYAYGLSLMDTNTGGHGTNSSTADYAYRYSFKDLIPAESASRIYQRVNDPYYRSINDIVVLCNQTSEDYDYELGHIYKISVDKSNTTYQWSIQDITPTSDITNNTVTIANESGGFGAGANAVVQTDAIQLGSGTNSTAKTLQVYSDNIYNADTHTLTAQNITLNDSDLSTTLSGKQDKTTYEELTVASTSWTSLSDSLPYTYQATVTLTTTLTDDSIVELLNNQAVLFATYNFAIGQISGQTITIYSIGIVGENVDFLVGVN